MTVEKNALVGALKVAGQQLKVKVPDDTTVTATVGIGPRAEERLREALRRVVVEALPAGTVISFSAGITRCAGVDDLEHAIERAEVRSEGDRRDAYYAEKKARFATGPARVSLIGDFEGRMV